MDAGALGAGWRWAIYKTEFVRAPPEPGDGPMTYRGRNQISLVAQGHVDAAPEGIYLMRVSLYSPELATDHPLAEVPFAIGIGYWQWIPPIGSGADVDELADNFAALVDEDHAAKAGINEHFRPDAGERAAIAAELIDLADMLAKGSACCPSCDGSRCGPGCC